MKRNLQPPKWWVMLTFSMIAAQLFGQNTNKIIPSYRFAFKTYLTVLHEKKHDVKTDVINRITENTRTNTTFLPVVGLTKLKKKGAFYEVSLTHLNFIHDDDLTLHSIFDTASNTVTSLSIPSRGAKAFKAHVGLRFEWAFPLFFEKLGRFQPYIGVSTDPSVFYENIVPYTTAYYPTIGFETRNTVSFIPRAVFNVSARLFLDLNVPISVFSMALTYNHVDNPILPTYARTETEFSTKLFPAQLNMRLGLGYKF